jgi:serine phosphatase RsbU (regulator of sigma subunit)
MNCEQVKTFMAVSLTHLANTVQRQRDDLPQDLEMAAQVQRLFLPAGKPAIPGLEVVGMIQPAKFGGDY